MKRERAQLRLEPELDRRLADVARRLDSAVTRAGIVIAGALVIAALPAGPTPGRWVPLGFASGATLLAGLLLAYRTTEEVPVSGLLERADEYTRRTMGTELFTLKLKMLTREEATMSRYALQLHLSYATLTLAAAATVMHHLGFL